MNPEEKELLQKAHDLSVENNNILRGMRRSNRWSSVFRFIYWIIIIGISVGAFVYIQPYMNTLLKTYSTLQTDLNSVKTIAGKLPNFNTTLPK